MRRYDVVARRPARHYRAIDAIAIHIDYRCHFRRLSKRTMPL